MRLCNRTTSWRSWFRTEPCALASGFGIGPCAVFFITAAWAAAQGLDPGALLKPPTTAWPMYNGDYTGRRYSSLNQINQQNVGSLSLAWAFQTRSTTFKATPLEVNGVLYFSTPDNVWAADAKTGRQIWHFNRPSEGDHIASRGVAMYKNRLYFGTPDAHLICLDARSGKQIWDIEIADVKFGYYLSVAPLVVKDRLIVGTSATLPMCRISSKRLTRNPEKCCGDGTACPNRARPGRKLGRIKKHWLTVAARRGCPERTTRS